MRPKRKGLIYPTTTIRNLTKAIVLVISVLVLSPNAMTSEAQGELEGPDKLSPTKCPVLYLGLIDDFRGHYSEGCESYSYSSEQEGFDTRARFFHFEVTNTTTVVINVESEWKNFLVLYDSNWKK